MISRVNASVSRCSATRSPSRSRRRSRTAAKLTSSAPTKSPPGARGQVAQERPAELVVVEDAVPRRAPHRPDRAATQELVAAVSRDDAVVDLIAEDVRPERSTTGPAERLLPPEHHRRRQQAQPVDRTLPALDVIDDAFGQHLVATADAEDGPAGRGPFGDGRGQPGVAQPGQVADRGPRPRHDDQIRVGQLLGPVGQPHHHPRLGRQRVEVGDVRQPGQPHGGDPQRLGAERRQRRPRPRLQVERVLGVQPQVAPPRQHAEHRPAGQVGEHPQPRFEQPGVAAELVDHEPGDEALVLGREHGQRPEHRREHPAAVDVADHDHRQVRGPGQAHVGQVAVAQVDLGRAARALADDHVEPGPQLGQGSGHHLFQLGLEVAVVQRPDLGHRLAEHDDLGMGLAAGLEQHRVHRRFGLDAAGRGLHGLGPADLRTGRGDERVEGHVLGLERRDPHPVASQPAADARGQHALARIGRGARDQQRAPHRRLRPT